MTLLSTIFDTPWIMMDLQTWFTAMGTVSWKDAEYFSVHHIYTWEKNSFQPSQAAEENKSIMLWVLKECRKDNLLFSLHFWE